MLVLHSVLIARAATRQGGRWSSSGPMTRARARLIACRVIGYPSRKQRRGGRVRPASTASTHPLTSKRVHHRGAGARCAGAHSRADATRGQRRQMRYQCGNSSSITHVRRRYCRVNARLARGTLVGHKQRPRLGATDNSATRGPMNSTGGAPLSTEKEGDAQTAAKPRTRRLRTTATR